MKGAPIFNHLNEMEVCHRLGAIARPWIFIRIRGLAEADNGNAGLKREYKRGCESRNVEFGWRTSKRWNVRLVFRKERESI